MKKILNITGTLYIVFIDQDRAFDQVNRAMLWRSLENYSIKGQLLDNIRALYTNSKCSFHTPHSLTDWFEVTARVRQGYVLFPLLFIMYMDHITKVANLTWRC